VEKSTGLKIGEEIAVSRVSSLTKSCSCHTMKVLQDTASGKKKLKQQPRLFFFALMKTVQECQIFAEEVSWWPIFKMCLFCGGIPPDYKTETTVPRVRKAKRMNCNC
jgi:hypothetical protein